MTDIWQNFTGEGSVGTGFPTTSQAETEDLTFLDYENLKQEQIVGTNDSESFVEVDFSTSSDSPEEEVERELRSDFKELVREFKAPKETYI